MNNLYTGLYTAIITPFRADGSFDESAFETIIEQQILAGVDGIVVLGTTGESPTVTTEEHDQIIAFAVKVINRRTKVIAGTGSNSTAEAIHHSLAAQKVGVDALLQVNPYYNKPTQKGLYEHFKAVADAVKIPIILYNIEGRTGVNLETPTLLRLAEHPNIVAVKEASGNLDQMKEVIENVPNDFMVLVGDDALCLDICKLGGHGVISVASNIIPVEMKSFVDDCLVQDWEAAEAFQAKYAEFFDTCFIETNPQPIKTLMAEAGLCEEIFRLPMVTMEAENKVELLKVFESIRWYRFLFLIGLMSSG